MDQYVRQQTKAVERLLTNKYVRRQDKITEDLLERQSQATDKVMRQLEPFLRRQARIGAHLMGLAGRLPDYFRARR